MLFSITHCHPRLMPLIATGCILSANAMAQERPIETIEVTGDNGKASLHTSKNSASNRLGLTIKEIPASVEVITKKEIADKADYSSLSAVTRATGFASSASPGNGGTSVSVRGFDGHGSVVQTYDGTRLYVGAGTVTFPADTWTLENIEVLRGPGSVINGIGAIGGTVNYVPKSPTFDAPSHEIDVTVGSFGLRRVGFGSGGEISSTLAYRLDIANHETDGYVDRADETRNVVAGALLFRPQDNLDIKLSVDYADIDAAPYWGTPLVNDHTEIDSDTRTNNYNVADGLIEYEDLWPRVHVKWKINDLATLTNDTYYLTAKRHWRNVESYDYDDETDKVTRSVYLEILHDQKQLGNRSNLLLDFDMGNMNNRLNIGAEINHIDFDHTNNSPYDGSTEVELDDVKPGSWSQGVVDRTTDDYTTDTLQYAIFADDVLQVNESLSLVAGLRMDKIDYEREDYARSNGDPAEEAEDREDRFVGRSWRLGAVYEINDNTSVYAQSSQAVDSIHSIISTDKTDLALAEGKQSELGVKQSLFDGRLQYTVSLFDIEKKNLLSEGPGDTQHQVGSQTSQGIEFELSVKPTDNIDIDVNIARVNAEYKEFFKENENEPDEVEDLSGNTPKNIPETTANLWVNWRLLDKWQVGGGARYVGKRYSDDENTTDMPEYTVLDASVQWLVTNDLGLTLRGKNLTDEEDYVLASYGNQWILGDGRSAEISVNYSF